MLLVRDNPRFKSPFDGVDGNTLLRKLWNFLSEGFGLSKTVIDRLVNTKGVLLT
jgi:hypothetical protein